jgi:hypothetical protein
MEDEKTKINEPNRRNSILLLILVVVGAFGWVWYKKNNELILAKQANVSAKQALASNQQAADDKEVAALAMKVIPTAGIELPVTWGDLGKQLIDNGVIDSAKFEAVYAKQGGITEEGKKLLYASDNKKIIITQSNAPIVLNLLWALGLGNKNPILDNGPMVDPKYKGAGGFSSTGGWSLSADNAMAHYSKHAFVTLTSSQQAIVERVSKGIYRPCCDNPTYFPDCNHGMAMLGFLELMASQGVAESDMYKYALSVNSYWFSNTYLTLAKYFEKNGTPWEQVDPKIVLGKEYSSASGYRQIQTKVDPVQSGGGAGCGV